MKTAVDFPIYVECPICGSKYNENEVENVGIEENIYGQDSVTFVCPRCDESVHSLRHG